MADAPSTTATPRPQTAPAPGAPVPAAAGGDIALGPFYLISANAPVPALATKMSAAYRAVDRRLSSEAYAGLICTGDVVPRMETMNSIKGLSKPGMLGLKEFGPVDWPGGKQRLAIIYTAPAGGRFVLNTPHQPWQIVDSLLRPAAAALNEIHNHGATHRAIRPDNLFLREAGGSALALGPCVATPPGYDQPDIYEPVETAIADPAGRGPGGPKHDMFALGMTALALLLGKQPGSEYDRDELMIRRLEMGSLPAVVPPHHVPREIVDAIWGMTADDESDRWTLGDLIKWLNAGRPDQVRRPGQGRPIPPYEIGGKQVRSARSLAYMLGRNWSEAARHVRADEMSRWVRDYAPERMSSALLDQAMLEGEAGSDAADGDPLMVTRAIMALDAEGPVRFRGLAVEPAGLGPFLFDAAANPERRNAAIAMLRYTLPQKVLEKRISRRRPDPRRATREAINFERLRRWVMSSQPWEGLERCIYDLNTNLPCLSPLTSGRWVANVIELVKALDDTASSGRVAEPALDTQIAAYIGARYDAAGDALLTLMKPKDADDDATLGAIRMFAELQQSFGSPPLPGIARWCAKLARRVAEGYRHRPTRQHMLEAIERAIPAGSVAGVLKAVDVPGLKGKDDRGFGGAKTNWAQLQVEIAAIQRDAGVRRERARVRGRDNAAFVSGAGSLLAMFITLFLDSAK
jgi:hypothetical protein